MIGTAAQDGIVRGVHTRGRKIPTGYFYHLILNRVRVFDIEF